MPMDLKLFFDPIRDIDISKLPSSAIVHSFYLNMERMPDLDGMDIALLGLQESRGANEINRSGVSRAPKEVRKQLYRLKKGTGNLKVVDLGNFRNGPELKDTYLRLQEVCAYLMEHNVLPVLIGGSHDLDLGQYMAYENQSKLISVLSVDNRLDLGDTRTELPSESHFYQIFRYDPNYLFSFYQLGYQSYLVSKKEIELLEKLYFEAYRLGLLKENIRELEPVIRDADMISFDISSLQAHYAPGGVSSNVYGLSGEEACQLCWYAGLNDKLSSIGFFEYDVEKDSDDRKTAFVLGTMIWYFIEGFYNRKGDKHFRSNDYLTYEVSMGGEPASIKFYKSKISEKWWMEVPHPDETSGFLRSRIIPCSYSDYETALRGEVPHRWITTYSRII